MRVVSLGLVACMLQGCAPSHAVNPYPVSSPPRTANPNPESSPPRSDHAVAAVGAQERVPSKPIGRGRGAAVQLTTKQIASVKRGLRESLKDPDSAKFGGMAAAEGSDGAIVVCGLVNAKNSYGGFGGTTPYNGLLFRRDVDDGVFAVTGFGGGKSATYAIVETCRRDGIAVLTLESPNG